MVMTDLYETRYGIYNHLSGNNKRRPLASVGMHPKEDYLAQSRLKMTYMRFLAEEVFPLTGEKWDDFINQPSYIIDIKLEAAAEYRKILAERKKKMQEEMEEAERRRQAGGK